MPNKKQGGLGLKDYQELFNDNELANLHYQNDIRNDRNGYQDRLNQMNSKEYIQKQKDMHEQFYDKEDLNKYGERKIVRTLDDKIENHVYLRDRMAGRNALRDGIITGAEFNRLKGHSGARNLVAPITKGATGSDTIGLGLAKALSIQADFMHQAKQVVNGKNSIGKGFNDFIQQSSGVYSDRDEMKDIYDRINKYRITKQLK